MRKTNEITPNEITPPWDEHAEEEIIPISQEEWDRLVARVQEIGELMRKKLAEPKANSTLTLMLG